MLMWGRASAIREGCRPLVAETNALLAARHADLEAARARAGDLAHALKTPLAVISAQVRTLEASGESDRNSRSACRPGYTGRRSLREARRVQSAQVSSAVKTIVSQRLWLSSPIASPISSRSESQASIDLGGVPGGTMK